MEYQVLYEDCRQSLEVKSEKNIWFAECQKMTLGKSPFCRVSGEDTRQRVNGGCRPLTVAAFAECQEHNTQQIPVLPSVIVCRVPGVCRVLSLWHSANNFFAECPIKRTRQSLGHSAKKPSPVVTTPCSQV